jgi:hypothetical protein
MLNITHFNITNYRTIRYIAKLVLHIVFGLMLSIVLAFRILLR